MYNVNHLAGHQPDTLVTVATSFGKHPGRTDDRGPYPEKLRASVYKYGLQGKNSRWVNEHWEDEGYFPNVGRNRPGNFDRTLRRWLKGLGVAQSDKDQTLFGDLRERHGVPQPVTTQMLEAAHQGPRLGPEVTFEERVQLWQAHRQLDQEASVWDGGETAVRYSLFVFGARTVDDFSSKVYTLFERLSPKDGVGWVMFDYELRKIVGLILP